MAVSVLGCCKQRAAPSTGLRDGKGPQQSQTEGLQVPSAEPSRNAHPKAHTHPETAALDRPPLPAMRHISRLIPDAIKLTVEISHEVCSGAAVSSCRLGLSVLRNPALISRWLCLFTWLPAACEFLCPGHMVFVVCFLAETGCKVGDFGECRHTHLSPKRGLELWL